jgi:hypothetical protein
MNPKLERLFNRYEEAFSRLDFIKISELYGDSFISAGPKGTIAQTKTDFLNLAEKAAEHYKAMGQRSGKLIEAQEDPITNEYNMVTVRWGVEFEKLGDKLVEFDISYIVQLTGAEPKIIMFITHQDEDEYMKKLKLM